MPEVTDPIFFPTPAELRAWLAARHEDVDEAWVGLYKKASGRPSVTWPELVDELLCFGWIDGVRKSLDDDSYAIRITPRRPRSIWSSKNLARYPELEAAGRVEPPGRAAYEARSGERTDRYSFEQKSPVELGETYEAQLRAHPEAWEFWTSQPPSYRKTVTWWVVSAKREETRLRRLRTLIEDCANGVRIKQMRRV